MSTPRWQLITERPLGPRDSRYIIETLQLRGATDALIIDRALKDQSLRTRPNVRARVERRA